MFTGIVEEIGTVASVETREGATRLDLSCSGVLEGVQVGDSIGVCGVCLTVTEFTAGTFACEAVPETLRCTNLGRLRKGDRVNLERAVTEGRPFGGHYVQGHVDDIAEVVEITPDGEAFTYRFRVTPGFTRYLVPKGFVTVDGASLTVVEAGEDWFTVTLIPHSQENLVMGIEGVGYVVNIEVDVMGKYVESFVGSRLESLEARLAQLEAAK
ncbi:MAG: riboflavin synthase [Deltaproteobacteria bacterium]|nr:MAG: riboflavin synthase [Deltaproteobacteria bacterium]